MIHVLPTRLSPETVKRWRQDERKQIVRYGAALAHEQATRRAVDVWRGLHERCRARMETMHRTDRERLHGALRKAEHRDQSARGSDG